MIIAEMRTRHVPMKVLRLQIQREHVGEQDIQRARNIPHGIRLQVAWGVERSGPCFGISSSNLHFLSPSVLLMDWTSRPGPASLPPLIHPPIAHVPSAIRVGLRVVAGI